MRIGKYAVILSLFKAEIPIKNIDFILYPSM